MILCEKKRKRFLAACDGTRNPLPGSLFGGFPGKGLYQSDCSPTGEQSDY